MGVVPKLDSSCFCCSLKTGSFVTAWLLLVGSGVQTGFYAFLVDHMNPRKICTYEQTVWVDADLPVHRDYPHVHRHYPPAHGHYPPVYSDDDFYGPGEVPDDLPLRFNTTDPPPQRRPHDLDAVNKAYREQTNRSYAANATDAPPGNSSHEDQRAANTAAGQLTTPSHAASTTGHAPTNSSHTVRSNSTVRRRRRAQFLGLPIFFGAKPRLQRSMTQLEKRPCPREYKPFDADSDLLNFDVSSPFDKTILYVNIVLWDIMMAGTVLLMAAVYKESPVAVSVWLVSEAVLLAVAAAAAVATAVLMFRAVPVQIGIVTLLNMAIHLGIDIYLMMVVENYRRKLTTKEEDEEDEQVIV